MHAKNYVKLHSAMLSFCDNFDVFACQSLCKTWVSIVHCALYNDFNIYACQVLYKTAVSNVCCALYNDFNIYTR